MSATSAVPRVVLRPLTAADEPALHRVLADSAVRRFTALPPSLTRADAAAMIERSGQHAAIGSVHTFAVARAETPEALVGLVSASRLSADIELGCALGQAEWGNRLMTEAMRILLAWATQHAPGRRAWGTCDVDHTAARRMLEDLGFTVERPLPRYRVHPALGPDPRDCVLYSRRLAG